jgi:hypothetical protein
MSRKYHQGFYRVVNKDKYRGKTNQIVYRSGLELKYFKHFDLNPNILEWASEEVIVPYRSPKDGRMHRYFVDIYIKILTRDGSTKEYLVEIKPETFTKKPTKKKNQRRKTYENNALTWIINEAKWKAAKSYCVERDWEFLILTERDLKIRKK